MDQMIKCKFKGIIVWIEPSLLKDGATGPLAPDEHVEDGELNIATCFSGDSFAHAYADGSVMRYGREVGTKKDIVPVHATIEHEALANDL